MRQIASLALALALFAAPAALAADCQGHAAKASCCAKKAGSTATDKKCDPATCKDKSSCDPSTCKGHADHKTCTPEQKARCGADKAAPAAPKS